MISVMFVMASGTFILLLTLSMFPSAKTKVETDTHVYARRTIEVVANIMRYTQFLITAGGCRLNLSSYLCDFVSTASALRYKQFAALFLDFILT
jgi:hypothetical protein